MYSPDTFILAMDPFMVSRLTRVATEPFNIQRSNDSGLLFVTNGTNKTYEVWLQDGEPISCTCPDYQYRGSKIGKPCKHMLACINGGAHHGA